MPPMFGHDAALYAPIAMPNAVLQSMPVAVDELAKREMLGVD